MAKKCIGLCNGTAGLNYDAFMKNHSGEEAVLVFCTIYNGEKVTELIEGRIVRSGVFYKIEDSSGVSMDIPPGLKAELYIEGKLYDPSIMRRIC